jgi:DNA-binding NarL/FixJ family response regulator
MPDVLLLDMQLPDMTGIELMRTLKAQESRVVILALSAFADKAYITESLASGAAGYLIKRRYPRTSSRPSAGFRGEQGWVSRQWLPS